MNLKSLTLEDIPIGKPLPWQLYDRDGNTLFAHGETVANRQQLENLIADGLLRDIGPLPAARESEVEDFEALPLEDMFPPRGIKPQVWERMQLRLLSQNTPTCYYSRLIGHIKDQSILVTTPVENGHSVIMADGERIEVRMLTGCNIFVFQSMVQRTCVSPSRYLHLEHPSRVSIQRLRKTPRAGVNLTATVSDAQGGQGIAHIANLGPGGAQINIPHSMGREGDPLRLTFQAVVDGLKTTLSLDTEIRHVRPAGPEQSWGEGMLAHGIAFRNVPPGDELWLRCLVYQRIAEGHVI